MATRNPFVCDLTAARTVFLRTIQAAQAQGESQAALEAALDATLSRLDQQWAALKQLTTDGLVDQAPVLLHTLLKEWAIKEALELLLRKFGMLIDSTHPGLQRAIQEKLERQLVL